MGPAKNYQIVPSEEDKFVRLELLAGMQGSTAVQQEEDQWWDSSRVCWSSIESPELGLRLLL